MAYEGLSNYLPDWGMVSQQGIIHYSNTSLNAELLDWVVQGPIKQTQDKQEF